MRKPGDRIGAILGSDSETKIVQFLGYGVYGGDFIPDEAVGWLAEASREYGNVNPCLRLDNGDFVYGCECWWGSEAEVKQRMERWKEAGYSIATVKIDDVRREYKLKSKDEYKLKSKDEYKLKSKDE